MWSVVSDLAPPSDRADLIGPGSDEQDSGGVSHMQSDFNGAGANLTPLPDSEPALRHNPPRFTHISPEAGPLEDVPLYEELLLLYAAQRPSHRTPLNHPGPPLNALSGIEMPRTNTDTQLGGAHPPEPPKQRIKTSKTLFARLGLRFLNSRQHFALALSRDISLIPALLGIFNLCKYAIIRYRTLPTTTRPVHFAHNIIEVGVFEHLLAGLWCLVSAILSYSMLDGLIGRWIITYLTLAAIVRVLSMSTIMISLEQYLVLALSTEGQLYALHIWILISCILTVAYTVQSFVTSNTDFKLDEPKKARFFDIYNIVVFAVVPVGLASFITMIGLLRSILIMRIDLDNPIPS